MSRYYTREGEPTDTAPEWFRVAESDLSELGYRVSTVFLMGIDHRFGPGKPLLYETMVFPTEGRGRDNFCARYVTESAAAEGHRLVVAALINGALPEELDPPPEQ